MRIRRERGFSLCELLVIVSMVGLIAACCSAAFFTLRRKMAVRATAREVHSILRHVRQEAIARGANVGLKFSQASSGWSFDVYLDGDGDGVRNDDISRGVDRRLRGPESVGVQESIAALALPPYAFIDPDGSSISPTQAPVQFNRSTICSFSPIGAATPGTVYISDRANVLYAVRVYGTTAKIRTIRYDQRRRRWDAY